jgi:thymidine kinase
MSFNKEQLNFINSDICDCVVYGNPGCGKTTSIIEYVINKNIGSKEFLIISFSKQAQIDFISRSKVKYNIFNNINVRTIHSVAYAIITKILGKSSTMYAAIILSAYKNIEKYNFDLSTISFLSKCKFIIVDEAQDINKYQYDLIKLIASKLNIPLILVGDPNQNIYQFQGGDDKYLLNHSDKKYNLIKNYRSTKEIINFCNYIRPHEILPKMEPGNLNLTGLKPTIICKSNDDILKSIKYEILKGDYKYHEIAIIGSVKLSKFDYQSETYKSLGLQQVCNYLNKHNINFVKYYKDGNNIDFDNNDKIEAKEGYINILTAHSSKGLEFKKVLIINYHFTTFSTIPTLEDYNKFRYLWYVAFTRAKNELMIYVNDDKYVFTEIKKISEDNYIKQGNKLKYNNYEYSKDIKPLMFSITEFINSNKYCNENVLYELENNYSYSIKTNKLFDIDIAIDIDIDINEIYEHNIYSLLYGKFIEELFVYYYYKNNISCESYINRHKSKLQNTIVISKKDIKYTHLLKKLGYITTLKDCIVLYKNIDKSKLNDSKIFDFVERCKSNSNDNNSEYINILFENNLYEYDKNKLLKLFNSILDNDNDNDTNNEKIIFDIVLYYYQIENECMHILNRDFSKHLTSIEHYYNKISNLTLNKTNYDFQVLTRNNHMNMIGILDILDNNDTIIELKFCKNINYKHILQLLLYNNNYYFNKKTEIWNLYDGKKYIIHFLGDTWAFNCYLSTIIETKMEKNIFLLDIETNTINNTIDFTEPNNTEIIDRYVYEYNFDYCISSGLIKNRYTLTTTNITGITETELLTAENLDKFKNDMEVVMNYCDKPVFIAHNGNRFDYPILYHHKILNKYNIKTLDTVNICRLFIKDKISNKLIDIYNYLYNDNITQTHRAKEDTILLKKILRKLNLTINDLINISA